MTARPPSLLDITLQTRQQTLSVGQKKFNNLIRKIESQQQRLADWQEAVPLYRQRRSSEFEPLLETYRSLNVELAHFLDGAHGQKGLSKTDRQTISEVIRALAASLMDGDALEAMKALYNKHSDSDFDTEQQQAQQALKSMVEDDFGLDLGDDVDLSSPEEVLRRLQQQMQAEQTQRAEERDRRRAGRKPTARQLRQQAEQQQASQSLREVYRKLASALHPDRETDPQERERKTALMQRVNQAYAGNRLLDMLQLQLEIEQIDVQHIHTLTEARLKHYNQVMAEQLAELQNETRGIEEGFKLQVGMHPYDPVTPGNMMSKLRAQMQLLQHDIHHLRRQRQLLGDIRNLKRWLKEQRQQQDADDGFPDDLLAMLR